MTVLQKQEGWSERLLQTCAFPAHGCFESCSLTLVFFSSVLLGGFLVLQNESLCQSFFKENINTYWARHGFTWGQTDYSLLMVVN